jgi:transposase
MHVIGEDKSEQLDIIPAKLQVIVTRRPRYGCRACEGAVVQALAPDRPITGGMATPGFLALFGWRSPPANPSAKC